MKLATGLVMWLNLNYLKMRRVCNKRGENE